MADSAARRWITLPPNTTETVYIPAANDSVITEGGLPVAKVSGIKFLREEPGMAVYAIEAGSYHFQSSLLP